MTYIHNIQDRDIKGIFRNTEPYSKRSFVFLLNNSRCKITFERNLPIKEKRVAKFSRGTSCIVPRWVEGRVCAHIDWPLIYINKFTS